MVINVDCYIITSIVWDRPCGTTPHLTPPTPYHQPSTTPPYAPTVQNNIASYFLFVRSWQSLLACNTLLFFQILFIERRMLLPSCIFDIQYIDMGKLLKIIEKYAMFGLM